MLFPLKELNGMDKTMLSIFVKMLKSRTDKDENKKMPSLLLKTV